MDINENDLKCIINNGDTKLLVNQASVFGASLAKDSKHWDEKKRKEISINKLTTSQIRNFFGTMKKIESKDFDAEGERELLLLKPKLAYAAQKAGKTKLNNLRDVLTYAIDLVTEDIDIETKKTRFKNFCNLFEAILCYHKASGGN